MTLSLDKLSQIANTNGFYIKNIFKKHDKCKYIEFYSTKISENILVTVSDNFKFKTSDKGYEIIKIDIDKLSEKKLSINDDINMTDFYTEIELKQLNIDKLEDDIINEYKKNINLSSNEKNIEFVNDDINQLKRMSNCVSNLKYKFALIHKVWLFISDKNNKIYCYNIKDFKPIKFKYLYIMIDLETFLSNIENINTDIEKIQTSLSETVDKTGKKMISKINELYPLIRNIDNITLKIEQKKNYYRKYEDEFKQLLNIVQENEIKILEKINLLPKISNMKVDLERGNLEKELSIIISDKKEIIGKIVNIKEKTRDLMLIYDTIIFESIILSKKIFDNVKKLNEIIK